MILFLTGLFTGSAVTVSILSLMVMAKRGDR